MCRLVFHGHVLVHTSDPDYRDTFLPPLRIFKDKHREGTVERFVPSYMG